MNVYDFDKTIYYSDSTKDFYLYCLRRHPKMIKYWPSLIRAFIKFRTGSYSKTQFKEILYRFLRCIDADKEVALFWNKKKSGIKKWYLNQKRKDDLIISASPVFLLKPICDILEVDNLIASNVNPKTGEYSGENCHGEEKVLQMYKIYGRVVPDNFYSDSYIDTPLAAIAKKSFIVKGEELSDWNFDNPKIKKYGYNLSDIKNL